MRSHFMVLSVLLGLTMLTIIAIVMVSEYSQEQNDRKLQAELAEKQSLCSEYLPPTTKLERDLESAKRTVKELQTGQTQHEITFEECMGK